MKLRMSPDLALSAEEVSETFAIPAKRGVGRTDAASMMTEDRDAIESDWRAQERRGERAAA